MTVGVGLCGHPSFDFEARVGWPQRATPTVIQVGRHYPSLTALILVFEAVDQTRSMAETMTSGLVCGSWWPVSGSTINCEFSTARRNGYACPSGTRIRSSAPVTITTGNFIPP